MHRLFTLLRMRDWLLVEALDDTHALLDERSDVAAVCISRGSRLIYVTKQGRSDIGTAR